MAGQPEDSEHVDAERHAEVASALRALGSERAPAAVVTRLDARLDAELGPRPVARARRRRRLLPAAGLAVPALAAALVAGVLVLGNGSGSRHDQQTAFSAAPAAQDSAGSAGTASTPLRAKPVAAPAA